MNSNFVVAEIEDSKPVRFYSNATASTLEMPDDLQQALVFTDKAAARAAQAAYQSTFNDKEVTVLPVSVQIILASK